MIEINHESEKVTFRMFYISLLSFNVKYNTVNSLCVIKPVWLTLWNVFIFFSHNANLCTVL